MSRLELLSPRVDRNHGWCVASWTLVMHGNMDTPAGLYWRLLRYYWVWTVATDQKLSSYTVLHPSVHVIALHSMTQQEGETTKSFAARVKGAAGNCYLSKTGVHGIFNVGGLRIRGAEVNKSNLPLKTRTCGYCGQPQHGEKNADKVNKCMAYNKECAKSQKMHHLAEIPNAHPMLNLAIR